MAARKPLKPKPAPPPPRFRKVVPKHHFLVRLTHWSNFLLLFGLIARHLSRKPTSAFAGWPGTGKNVIPSRWQ
jgi:hypothetical protein